LILIKTRPPEGGTALTDFIQPGARASLTAEPERLIRNAAAPEECAVFCGCRGCVMPCMRVTLEWNLAQVNTTELIRCSLITHEVSTWLRAAFEKISLRAGARC